MAKAIFKRWGDDQREQSERIASELHDNLFQGMQGILLRIHSTISSLEPENPFRLRLEETLTQADQLLLEGRQLAFELCSGRDVCLNLPLRIRDLGSKLNAVHGIEFNFSLHGEARSLSAFASSELQNIVREALWNAFRHSGVTKVSVDMRFLAEELSVAVYDDGRGTDRQITSNVEGTQQSDLPGMKERARAIHAKLLFEYEPSKGTTITVQIPGAVIYSPQARKK